MAKKAENETAQKKADETSVEKKKETPKTRSPKKLLEEAKTAVRANATKNPAKTKKQFKPRKKSEKKPVEISAEEAAKIDEEKARIISRRHLVFELKKAGASYRQISEHLKAKNIEGASVGQVHADYQFMLREASENLALSVEEYIEAEISLLDEIQFSFYQDIKRDSNLNLPDRKDAAGVIIQCIRERAKLRNLYKPVKIQLDTDDELAKLLGISKEELPPLEQSPDS